MKTDNIKLYFAPMEGVTKWVFRNIHNEMFGGCDQYWAPFITPTDNEKLSLKSLRDILPEHNQNIPLRVQVLTNSASAFLKFEERICQLGYDSVNINMGCPSGTVVKKGRGSGILRTTEVIDNLLKNVTESARTKISVKTRIGFLQPDEMEGLLEIFNAYPLHELVVHPRTRGELYGGVPHIEVFEMVERNSRNPVVYNGNLFTAQDVEKITIKFPGIEGLMIGRGALANPAIFREIRGGARLEPGELIEFSDRLIEKYKEVLGTEVYTLHKLKELWIYFLWNYPNEKKLIKSVKKSNSISELRQATRNLPHFEQNLGENKDEQNNDK